LLPRSSSSKSFSSVHTSQNSAQQAQVKMHAIQSQLQQLIANGHGKVDPAKLDPILAELEHIPGQHGLVGGVDIGVLRRNLKRASEMQRIALSIQAIAKTPNASSPESLKSAMNQLQKLQSEMEAVQVSVPNAAFIQPVNSGKHP